MPHGDLVPDFAALPEAVSVTSLDQITDGMVAIVEAGVTLDIDRLMDRNVVPECIAWKGTLRFDRTKDLRLVADTLFEYPGGTLDAGTHDDPLMGDVEIVTATRPIDPVRDPEQFIGGCVFNGLVRIHGSFTGAHRSRLTANVIPGDTTIDCADVDQWEVADEIILIDTRDIIHDYDPNHTHERRTIVSISGNTVGLSAPATYSHNKDANVGGVAHITRNIRFTSPQVDVAHKLVGPLCDARIHSTRTDNYGRTTVDILHDTHRDHMGNITQVGTNNRARYGGDHVHHCAFPYFSDRNVTINSETSKSKWGITHHDSEAHFSRNIMYGKIDGAGMAAEDGSETGSWIDNVVLCTAGIVNNEHTWMRPDYNRDKAFSDHPLTAGQPLEDYDRGFGGDAYWLAGTFIHVEGNWASGVFREGIQFNLKPRYDFATSSHLPVTVRVGPEAREEPYWMDRQDVNRTKGNMIRTYNLGFGVWEGKEITVTLDQDNIFIQGFYHSAVAAKHIFNHGDTANLVLNGCMLEKNNSNHLEKRGAVAWGGGSLVTLSPDTSIIGWDRNFE